MKLWIEFIMLLMTAEDEQNKRTRRKRSTHCALDKRIQFRTAAVHLSRRGVAVDVPTYVHKSFG